MASILAHICPLALVRVGGPRPNDKHLEARCDRPPEFRAQLHRPRRHFRRQMEQLGRLPPHHLLGRVAEQLLGTRAEHLDRAVERRGDHAGGRAVEHALVPGERDLVFKADRAQRDLRFQQPRKFRHQLHVPRRPRARLHIDRAKRADDKTVRRADRDAEIRLHAEIADREIVAHERVGGRIVHNQRRPRGDDVLAEGMRQRRLPRGADGSAQPMGRFEKLPPVVHKRHEADRCAD